MRDGALILMIVAFCAVFGFIQEYDAECALEALKKDVFLYHRCLEGEAKKRTGVLFLPVMHE